MGAMFRSRAWTRRPRSRSAEQKVEEANVLYDFTGEIALMCIEPPPPEVEMEFLLETADGAFRVAEIGSIKLPGVFADDTLSGFHSQHKQEWMAIKKEYAYQDRPP